MRKITVQLADHLIGLKIPVPSKMQAELARISEAESLFDQERVFVDVIVRHATGFPWAKADPVESWEAMWEAGVTWPEVTEAIKAWSGACVSAFRGLEAAATTEAERFPDRADDGGDRQP